MHGRKSGHSSDYVNACPENANTILAIEMLCLRQGKDVSQVVAHTKVLRQVWHRF